MMRRRSIALTSVMFEGLGLALDRGVSEGAWLDEPVLDVQGGNAGEEGSFLRFVLDGASGRFLAPEPGPAQALFRERAVKEAARLAHMAQSGWERSGIGEVEAPADHLWKPLEEDGSQTLRAPLA